MVTGATAPGSRHYRKISRKPRLPDVHRLGTELTRHGTTTLFAALDAATGRVVGRHYKRRRRIEFLDFMNQVVAAYPECQIHVVLDNLSTHKPSRDLWLARHKNVHLHYTPTHTSRLNQIEIWFSILSVRSLVGASLRSVGQLVQHSAQPAGLLEMSSMLRTALRWTAALDLIEAFGPSAACCLSRSCARSTSVSRTAAS